MKSNMKMKIIEKVLVSFGILNLIIFLLFLTFGNRGLFIVELPDFFSELILFYFPIVFTLLSIILFVFEYYKNNHKNWYYFFIIAISYLPVVLFVILSIHRPAH